VAVKVIKKADCQKEEGHIDSLHNELKTLEEIRHPTLLRVQDIVEDSKHLYIITELLEEGNLCTYISKRKRLSEESSRFITE